MFVYRIVSGIAFVLGLAFGPGAVYGEARPAIQSLSQINDEIVSLDNQANAADEAPTWWATTGDVDPVAEFERLRNNSPLTPEDVDDPGGEWRAVVVPGNLINQAVVEDGRISVWYRKSFFAPAGVSAPLVLRLGEISDRDQVYLNGQAIGATGDWDAARPQGYDRHRLYTLPDGVLRKDAANLLLVRVKGFFPYENGIMRNTTALGPAELMWRDHYLTNFGAVLLLIVYATVGGYFLFLFLRRLTDRENLFFALFAFGLVVYQFLRTQLKYELGLDFFAMKRTEYMVLATLGFTSYMFVRNYFTLPDNKIVRWFDRVMWFPAIVSLVQFIIVAVSNDVLVWNTFNDRVFLPTLMLFYVFGFLAVVVYGIRLKDRDAYFMLFGLLMFLLAFAFDAMTHYSIFVFPRILGYVFVLFVLSLALILANRFVRLHTEVEDLNRNLEKKVATRTEELNNTLTEVRALKVQQDGDYFLTSLLVRPLGGNFTRSELAAVDMLERQKKRFVFREREWEIGGDLNAAHDVILRDRRYVLVLNADAMGKSIQGAGGALVLGTVFKSLVNRTRHSAPVRRLFPEQWLKQAFLELQDTFVGFDGSMLVSVVIGLLDEETGLLYYINAEHPWTVLYRGGKAEFIEQDLSLRKVGIDLEGVTDGELSIKLFEMQAGDVLIFGSDGRDDIVIGEDSNGRRVINEEESQFLRRVEEGAGSLPAIENALRRQGEFSDDFTLVRLGFREEAPYPEHPQAAAIAARVEAGRGAMRAGESDRALQEFEAALAIDPRDRESLRSAAMIHIRAKDYERAVEYCQRYLDVAPGDTKFFYYTAQVLRQLGRLDSAADHGERCRLRNPAHLDNLLNLMQVYRAMGNDERAELIRSRARAIDPGHAKLR